MPDWSYQTLIRPVLFRMPAARARDLALGVMGRLSQWRLGEWIIDMLGHMRADQRLSCMVRGIEFTTPIGLGTGFDPHLAAPRALLRFGLGFLEVGPITVDPVAESGIVLQTTDESYLLHSPDANPGCAEVARRLSAVVPSDVPVLVRLAVQGSVEQIESQARCLLNELGPMAAGVVWRVAEVAHDADLLRRLAQAAREAGVRWVLLAVGSQHDTHAQHETVLTAVHDGTLDGVVIDSAAVGPQGRRMGGITFESLRDSVRHWRERSGNGPVVMASGGVHEPRQALELRAAGADLVQIDSGLVFAGPGLPKRINDALLFAMTGDGESDADARRPAHESWFWTLLMGVSLLLGGVMALVIAATHVVMPYDEAASGMTREQIMSVNDRLLDFMTHDRMTLSGTMLAVGILYVVLSLWGSRRGLHWAHVAISASAFAGFASFFLFLGFGYFDPFHAFVTAVLFQFLLLAVHSDLPPRRDLVGPNLLNDWRWRLSQWGQLIFVIHGAVLIVAGAVISSIGITTVFVPEDLEFMHTTAEHMHGAHPQLVPLVAHDRATFGGMLIACGVTVLLASLWGFRRGYGWLWWALMVGGHAAYVATIAVHWHVGYSSLKHLIPAYAGLVLLWLGGGLSYPYLCRRDPLHERLWRELRERSPAVRPSAPAS